MREIRQSGSVRGVRRKPYPYRDHPLPMRKHGALPTLPRTLPEATEASPADARHGSTLTPRHGPRRATGRLEERSANGLAQSS